MEDQKMIMNSRTKLESSPVDTLLGQISQERALRTNEWRKICIAAKSSGVSYNVFKLWSLTGPYKNNHNQIRRAWDNLQGNYTIGTLIHYAKLDSQDVDLSNLPITNVIKSSF